MKHLILEIRATALKYNRSSQLCTCFMKAIIDLTLSTFVANLGADQKDRGLWGQECSMKTSRHWNKHVLRFRAENRNKHARVLATRHAPSLKKLREFRRSCKQ